MQDLGAIPYMIIMRLCCLFYLINCFIIQCNLIRKFIYKNYKDLIGVEVLKAYEIQGKTYTLSLSDHPVCFRDISYDAFVSSC